MALVFPRIDVPANGPLGIRVDAHVLAYTVAGGITRQVECAVVKAVEDAAFQPGDILVSCNDRPLINCALQSGTSHLATVTAALTEAAHEDRTLLLLRSAAAGGYNPAYNTTIVTMSADEAAMIFDDAALQQQHEDERRAFEVQPASAELLSVTIPYEQPSLGLEIQVQRLTYVNDEGRKVSLDCCVVLDSHFRAQILPGDIIVKVNYNSVVSDRRVLCRSDADSRAFFDDFMGAVSSAERPLKLVYLRPSAGVGRRGLSPRLLVRLPRSLEDAVFMSTPLNVLSEDEEISRRVEEELYRLQKVRRCRFVGRATAVRTLTHTVVSLSEQEKDERARVEEERRKHEAELQAAAEAAEARRVEEEVLRRVEVEKRRITDELRHAEVRALGRQRRHRAVNLPSCHPVIPDISVIHVIPAILVTPVMCAGGSQSLGGGSAAHRVGAEKGGGRGAQEAGRLPLGLSLTYTPLPLGLSLTHRWRTRSARSGSRRRCRGAWRSSSGGRMGRPNVFASRRRSKRGRGRRPGACSASRGRQGRRQARRAPRCWGRKRTGGRWRRCVADGPCFFFFFFSKHIHAPTYPRTQIPPTYSRTQIPPTYSRTQLSPTYYSSPPTLRAI